MWSQIEVPKEKFFSWIFLSNGACSLLMVSIIKGAGKSISYYQAGLTQESNYHTCIRCECPNFPFATITLLIPTYLWLFKNISYSTQLFIWLFLLSSVFYLRRQNHETEQDSIYLEGRLMQVTFIVAVTELYT